MGLLDAASSRSVSRGFDYFKQNYVSDKKQVGEFEYEGYVKGSQKSPYYTKIDVKHPKKSYCDCPHANGNIICKHMIALYFTFFESDAEEYEEYLYSEQEEYDYDFDEDDYDYDDRYDDDYYRPIFNKPLFFDLVLNNYIDSLSLNELRKVLKEELSRQENDTFRNYLKNNYATILDDKNLMFLEDLNQRMSDFKSIRNFDYLNYGSSLFSNQDIKTISLLYQNKNLHVYLDRILMTSSLTVYKDYRVMVDIYKQYKTKKEIVIFCEQLEEYVGVLKSYKIRNDIPKANVLIIIYLLRKYTMDELVESIIKNAKYKDYVDFVISDTDNVSLLYKKCKNKFENNYHRNKQYIPDLIAVFIHCGELQDLSLFDDYYLYAFLCIGDVSGLPIFEDMRKQKDYVEMIESKTNNDFLLSKLYVHYKMVDALWNLSAKEENRHLLNNHYMLLKDKYNQELYEHFYKCFYKILEGNRNREEYRKAAVFIKYISHLNNGDELVANIISQLKSSELQKNRALFDEIDKALH